MANRVTNPDGKRFYLHPNEDGSQTLKLWSVTTITQLGIPKPQLIEWAAKVTAEFAFDNLTALWAMKKRADEAPEDEREEALAKQRDGAVDYLRGERRRSTGRAALRGSHIHQAIDAYKLGKPYPGVPKKLEPWHQQFIRMMEEHEPIVLQSELKVVNRERLYAGTLDNIMVWPSLAQYFEPPFGDERGPVLLADYKSRTDDPARLIYPETALQLCAYSRAEFMVGPDGSEHPMPKIDGALGIALRRHDYDIMQVDISDRVWRSYLFAYEIARWQEDISKSVIDDPLPKPTREKVSA